MSNEKLKTNKVEQWEDRVVDFDSEDKNSSLWDGEDSDEAALRHMYEEARKKFQIEGNGI